MAMIPEGVDIAAKARKVIAESHIRWWQSVITQDQESPMDASPPNESLRNTAPMPRMGADGVGPPDHRFDQSKAKQARIPMPIEPGEGAIPVAPYDERGLPNQAGSLTDMIKPKPRPMK